MVGFMLHKAQKASSGGSTQRSGNDKEQQTSSNSRDDQSSSGGIPMERVEGTGEESGTSPAPHPSLSSVSHRSKPTDNTADLPPSGMVDLPISTSELLDPSGKRPKSTPDDSGMLDPSSPTPPKKEIDWCAVLRESPSNEAREETIKFLLETIEEYVTPEPLPH
ncbi:hypothetical protein LTR36_010456 [Oleoguttula mirabilis]|uniref:Uncharacterized protein n=1 Tax=Oleoguttula mirabilis TaxID=1507867 RepID=A0AAV9J4E8_9PEZI|nr:hypothetical protein LTR36_010456 [Oleoguttula mirabilis]